MRLLSAGAMMVQTARQLSIALPAFPGHAVFPGKPSYRAVMVATSRIASFTASFAAARKW
jgi:hypothetical protein